MIPQNVTSLISAAKDGDLGVFDNCKIGELFIDALVGLQTPYSKTITSKPVQSGFNVNDAAIEDANPITLDIVLTNPDISITGGVNAIKSADPFAFTKTWRDKKKELFEMWYTNTVVDVQTHSEIFESYLIQTIDPRFDSDEDLDCYQATVILEPFRAGDTGDDFESVMDATLDLLGGI